MSSALRSHQLIPGGWVRIADFRNGRGSGSWMFSDGGSLPTGKFVYMTRSIDLIADTATYDQLSVSDSFAFNSTENGNVVMFQGFLGDQFYLTADVNARVVVDWRVEG